MEPKKAFYITAEFLSHPGVFGLILAALTAALMSTVDTLITAVSAIVVNDVYKPLRPSQGHREAAAAHGALQRRSGVTLFGIALVPVFMQFKTIYAAHGAMTAAVTPPLVVALLLAVFWRRFTAAGRARDHGRRRWSRSVSRSSCPRSSPLCPRRADGRAISEMRAKGCSPVPSSTSSCARCSG